MTTVKNLLDRKGRHVWAISPNATVREAANAMNEYRVGALLVQDGEDVVGIFTERDVLTRVIGHGSTPDILKVSDVMTTPVAFCTPETPVEVCKAIFTEKRIRHLPVMESNRAIGLIATGDVMAYEARDLQETVNYLQSYIYEG